MADTSEVFGTVTAGGQVLLVMLLIVIAYVVAVSPVKMLSGKAEGKREYAAAIGGIVFWLVVAKTFVGT